MLFLQMIKVPLPGWDVAASGVGLSLTSIAKS